MQRLIKGELLTAGLVRLTPHLAERYSECLVSMGLPPVETKEGLEIDGIGASPQVAKERGNSHYLCNGLANPLAVIVCPEQYNKPVYFQIFSWERQLMRMFFDKYHREIIDVTGTHSISIELEDGISKFEDPRDLFLMNEITAIPHIEELAEAALRQRELIGEFGQDERCLDEELCDKIIESRKTHGDLRKRKVTMQPMKFDSFDDFYTVAFGGAAVLRRVDGVDILVLENKEEYENIRHKKKKGEQIFHLFDPDFRLFNALRKAQWVQVPIEKYRADPKLISFKRELLLADALCDCEEKINWRTLTATARQALMQRHEDRVPAIYAELERFAARLKRGTIPELSPDLEHFLAEPSETLPPSTQDVVWTLLVRREPRNLLGLYTVDKNAFLALYEQWSDAKREWAADYLVERYKHKYRVNPERKTA